MIKHLQSILTQSNAGTAHPFFVVYVKSQFPIDPSFSTKVPVYVNFSSGESEEMTEKEYEKLEESYESWRDSARMEADGTWAIGPPQYNDVDFDPQEWEPVHYEEINEFKSVFFTRAAAEEYIERNKHNLRLPFIDVDSAYRNQEIIDIRAALIEAAKKARNLEVTV